jgi:hypothetical protein
MPTVLDTLLVTVLVTVMDTVSITCIHHRPDLTRGNTALF